MSINWKSVGALLTSALGIVLSPAVLGALPAKWAGILTGIGIILQSVSHPVAASTSPATPSKG